MLQTVLTAALVAAAFGYSAWVLSPASWRSALLRRLGRSVLPAGGGCGGCGGGCARPPRPAPDTAVVQVHRRAAATARPDGSAGAAAP